MPIHRPIAYQEKLAIEQILQKNNKHGSRTKYFSNNVGTSSSGPPKATLVHHKPKENSVCFVDLYQHTNPMDSANYETHLVYSCE